MSNKVAAVPGKKISKTDRISVACQTDVAYSPPTGSAPTVSQAQCDNLGTSGTVKAKNVRMDETKILKAAREHIRNAASSSTPNDGEGTLVLKIQQFSKMGDTFSSPSKRISGVPWRIMVMPKQHMVQKKSQKCMGFFLQCCPDKTYSDAWSCKADAEMRLVAKKTGASNFVRKTSHTYTSKENDWGYSCFMTWADVLDENQGYIDNDQVTLEITVKADLPKNMMSREDFCKSIDQWYNLAEMQMGRGLIDLSIEANAQALKFCKDKDPEMKTKLEEQKERLVKKKVVDSINRIEKKKDGTKPTEPLKPTSLRQALTGAQKTIAAKGCVKPPGKKDRRATIQQLKKKKQDLACKEKELKRKTAEWEEVNSQLSMSSEEARTPPTPGSRALSPERDDNHREANTSTARPVADREEAGICSAHCVHRKEVEKANQKQSTSSENRRGKLEWTDERIDGIRSQYVCRHHCHGVIHTHQRMQFRTSAKIDRDMVEKTLGIPSDLYPNGAGIEVEVSGTGSMAHENIFRALKENIEKKLNGCAPAVDEESSDNSEDYREDDSMHGMCDQCAATGQCMHDSLSSLEEAMESVMLMENGCQTEESGELVPTAAPQPNPRRERRPAGSGVATGDSLTMNDILVRQMRNFSGSTDEVIKNMFAHYDPKGDEVERQRLLQFCQECFGIDNVDLSKELEAALSVIEGSAVDLPSLSANLFTRLDTLSDDHGTCCLVAGLCTVQSRRIIQGASEFCKIASALYNEEHDAAFARIIDHDKLWSLCGGRDGKPESEGGENQSVAGRKLATARRRKSPPRSTYRGPVKANHGPDEECTCHLPSSPTPDGPPSVDLDAPHPFEFDDIDFDPPTPPEPVELEPFDVGEADCEKSIRGLLADIGNYQVDNLISEKVEAMRSDGSYKALYQLLNQLFGYSQALASTGDRMEELVSAAHRMERLRQGSNGINVRTADVLRKSEEKLAESEKFIKKLGTEHLREVELRKKLQHQLGVEETKYKAEHERAEQLHVQLRDVRNQQKKAEKKAKQDENRIMTLQSDKSDLEDKNKALRKDLEQLKKKSSEERSKLKREKDRDADLLRRCESDIADKEAEREREKQIFEEKLQQAKNKENKWEKERKQHLSNVSSAAERARASEVALLQLTLSTGLAQLEKTKENIKLAHSDAEENLKRARTHSDMEAMRRSVAEWRSAEEEVEKIMTSTKNEYESAIELVSKGTKTLLQFSDLKIAPAPPLPKVVRLPPVQVVQPSTPVAAPPTISQPPAGVIGQPRTPQLNRYGSARDMNSPSSSNSPASVSLFARPSSPIRSPMKLQPIGTPRGEDTPPAPAASPWSWSTPLGNLSDMIRPASEPQHPGQHAHAADLWVGPDGQTQLRAAYGQPPIGWTPQGNWRPNQPSQMRSPGMPYFDS